MPSPAWRIVPFPDTSALKYPQAERLDAKAAGLAAAISGLEAQIEAEVGRARLESRTRVRMTVK